MLNKLEQFEGVKTINKKQKVNDDEKEICENHVSELTSYN